MLQAPANGGASKNFVASRQAN
ncbi:protein of unknown function [Shinella sp. WSC3-e]|nr:hypothetical protein SHINE37_40497 [Rhizobiaceae bacterium]CAK7255176.1 protein of unknown function [Shinella sp. WSC3-e]